MDENALKYNRESVIISAQIAITAYQRLQAFRRVADHRCGDAEEGARSARFTFAAPRHRGRGERQRVRRGRGVETFFFLLPLDVIESGGHFELLTETVSTRELRLSRHGASMSQQK